MMLKPSIDKLLDVVDSKYSLVILEAKRAHDLAEGEPATQKFESAKPTLQALEEIESGHVVIHPDPDARRESFRVKRELAKAKRLEEEKRIKEQLAREAAEEEARALAAKGKKVIEE